MSKYYRVTADYRPFNPKKPQYVFKVDDSVTKRQMKNQFERAFSWLKVYEIKEIDEQDI